MAEFAGTPPLVCSFALGRGRYCIRRYRHDGEHMPSRRVEPTPPTATSDPAGTSEQEASS